MILGLDTTTECLHLALVDPVSSRDRVWTESVVVAVGDSHSSILLPTVDKLLKLASLKPSDLSGVIVCLGPGGFTSLRIGVATAEGLSITGLPTWGFSAFKLRAKMLHLALGYQWPIWICLDAQRQEVFMQLWVEGEPIMEPIKQSIDNIEGCIGGYAWWAPASFRHRIALNVKSKPQVLEREVEYTLLSLVSLCIDLSLNSPEPLLVPFYLRAIDAEVNFPEASGHLPEILSNGQLL